MRIFPNEFVVPYGMTKIETTRHKNIEILAIFFNILLI